MEQGLVSCEWLRDELAAGARDLRVVDATWYLPNSPFAAPEGSGGAAADFDAGPRLPGAVFFDIDGVATPHPAGLQHMLPNEETFSNAMMSLGVEPSTRVVIYDRHGVFSSPRCWYTLKVAFRHPGDVAVLDGGLPRWRELGFPLDEEPQPSHKRQRVEPATAGATEALWRRDPEASWTLEQVLSNIDKRSALLVDARSAGRFHGTAPEPRAGMRGGHVPGSASMPFTDLLTGPPGPMMMLPVADLEAKLRAAGVPVDEVRTPGGVAVVASCGSGLTSCVVGLALHLIGMPLSRFAVYDGSWAEWGASATTPIVRRGADGGEEAVP